MWGAISGAPHVTQMSPAPPFTVQDIVRASHGALVAGDLGIPVTGVSIDSRSLAVGDAFFAIQGHRLDGHAFLAEAGARPRAEATAVPSRV